MLVNEARRDRPERATSPGAADLVAGTNSYRATTAAEPRAAARTRLECGELPFLVQRDGTWLYRGTPILRKELVCLFSSVLHRMADGSFWLETPAERGRIEVEDTPWIAGELEWCGHGRDQVLSFRTNVDQCVTAGPEHAIRVSHDGRLGDPTPYIVIRTGSEPGAPPLEARISRAVYYELVALAVPETVAGTPKLGVWSNRRFFALGDLPVEMEPFELEPSELGSPEVGELD